MPRWGVKTGTVYRPQRNLIRKQKWKTRNGLIQVRPSQKVSLFRIKRIAIPSVAPPMWNFRSCFLGTRERETKEHVSIRESNFFWRNFFLDRKRYVSFIQKIKSIKRHFFIRQDYWNINKNLLNFSIDLSI